MSAAIEPNLRILPDGSTRQPAPRFPELSASVEAEMATVHLDAAALARRYGWTVQGLYNMRSRGADLPPAIIISGRPRWRLSDVKAWENSKLEQPHHSK